jgi:hypothetical protein
MLIGGVDPEHVQQLVLRWLITSAIVDGLHERQLQM